MWAFILKKLSEHQVLELLLFFQSETLEYFFFFNLHLKYEQKNKVNVIKVYCNLLHLFVLYKDKNFIHESKGWIATYMCFKLVYQFFEENEFIHT